MVGADSSDEKAMVLLQLGTVESLTRVSTSSWEPSHAAWHAKPLQIACRQNPAHAGRLHVVNRTVRLQEGVHFLPAENDMRAPERFSPPAPSKIFRELAGNAGLRAR
jgi:hypothetical protein